MPKTIVYSLTQHPILQCYIPIPYVCDVDKDGNLGYMIKKASPEVIASFQSISLDEANQRCITICEDLTDESLHHRFIKTKRNTIVKLLADPLTAKPIRAAVDKQVNETLNLFCQHQLPVCLNIERKTRLESLRVHPHKSQLSPILKFEKTQTGIMYTLRLVGPDQSEWHPADLDPHMVCNQPGWVILKRQLFQVQYINGNKLKPFLKKKTITIPNHLSHTYLEKFVYSLIAKVKVEVIGFDLKEHTERPKATLKAREDFITDTWILDLVFSYQEETFHYWAKEKTRTKLHYGQDNSISFSLTRRQDDVEEAIIEILKSYGVIVDPTKRLVFKEPSEDSFFAIHWLKEHKTSLEADHISIELPRINDHTLSFDDPEISMSQIEENDWFDIKAMVTVGNQQVPFSQLIDHIKSNNRVFEMENGEAFIIPLEWMTQYAGLARWAQVEDQKVCILKSQFSLLQDDSKADDDSLRIYEAPTEDIDFSPSPMLKATLRPYQYSGVQWLINHQQNGLGCCLADDMGLGKTIQTIAALLHAREGFSNQNENHNENLKENQNQKEIQNQKEVRNIDSQQPMQEIKVEQLDLFGAVQESIVDIHQTIENVAIDPPLEENNIQHLPTGRQAQQPTLIVMPSSLLFNWQLECKKFAPHLHIKKHIGSKRAKSATDLTRFDVILTSYQTALRDIDMLVEIDWHYVILDESQYIKNPASKIFSAIQQLSAEHKLSLSGTPIENSLSDLWSQMQFINPDILGSYSFFKKHFQKPIEKDQDESLIDELKTLTSPFLLRRTKAEVLPELPEKTEQIVYCEMSSNQAKLYDTEKSATRNMILQSDLSDPQVKMQVLSSLLRLRQLSNHPSLCKADYLDSSGKFEVIKESFDTVAKSGHKALIFSSFTKHLDLMASYLSDNQIDFVSLTGKTSQKNRQKAVKAFQENESIQFFLISIKAGGTGLNLTAADYVFILDPWWNPFIEEQAIARAHRIGLEHPLNVIRFISKETIEEKINKLQQKKLKLSEEFIDRKDTLQWTADELQYLLD